MLDREIIRRAIGRHIQEVKHCYEEELRRAPALAGRITIRLSIEPSGRVSAASIERSTLDNPRVESCVRESAAGWVFPAVADGGLVVVSYPFVLLPTGAFHPSGDDGEARAILAGNQPLADRLRRISLGYGLRPLADPRLLAFAIESRRDTLQRLMLVARLLAMAGRRDEAIRVLSERAPFDADEIAAELRRLSADADAAEVLALAQRAR